MKTIKVSEATNTQLDWLVAKCEGLILTKENEMSHGMICLLDSTLRGCWYGQGKFPLSHALFVSAKRRLAKEN